MNNPGDILLSPSPRPPPPQPPPAPPPPPPTTTISQDSSLSTCTKSPDTELSPSHHLPHSVKGAPAHLRPSIRKRQNSESAKRSRMRRKEAARRFYERFDQQRQRIRMLEQRVADMTAVLACDDNDDHQHRSAKPIPEHPLVSQNHDLKHPPTTPVRPSPIQPLHSDSNSLNELHAIEADLDALLDSCVQAEIYEEEGIYAQRTLW